ncbi:MAG TPA: DUF4340 domain-containing protein [Bdellovibrionales bacterium]|nr:DUF4340 domain-containing protein [Bdellovibrionales bacterium]
MKQFRGTLIMAVIVGLLAAYAYFGEFKKRKAEETVKEQQAVVVKIEKDKVSRVKLTKDGKTLEIKKEGADWHVTQPVQDLADEDAIKGWVENLTTEKSESEITEQIDWAIFGLDKPFYTVELEGDGKTETISVGKDAIGGKIYLRRNQDNAVLVANAIWKGFGDKTAKDLRNKSLYRLEGKSASSLKIETKKGGKTQKTSLVKKDGAWQFEGGEGDVGADEVGNYISQIENLKATDVAGEDKSAGGALAKNGLSNPMVKVTLGFTDGTEPWTLLVSEANKQQEAFASAGNLKPVYKIFGTSADALVKGPGDFRDKKKPFEFQRADVKGLEINTGSIGVSLEQKDGTWALAESSKASNANKEVDQAKVSDLLSQVGALKAKEFVKADATSFKKYLKLKAADGKPLLELMWSEGAKGKNEYKVKSSNSKEFVTLDTSSIDSLPVQTLLKDKATPAPSPSNTQSSGDASKKSDAS